MLYAIQNQSSKVSDVDAQTMTNAVLKQVVHDIAPAWGRLPPSIVFFPKGIKEPKADLLIVILDNPDTAGALGYHDETPSGQDYAKIFVDPVLSSGGAILKGKDSSVVTVSSVLSHEVAEAFVDPACNSWCDGPLTVKGVSYKAVALEVGDPVEAGSYPVDNVMVSNFVTPQWFDLKNKVGPFDYMKTLSHPMTMSPGGYLILRKSEGGESQVFGDKYVSHRLTHSKSRRARRTS